MQTLRGTAVTVDAYREIERHRIIESRVQACQAEARKLRTEIDEQRIESNRLAHRISEGIPIPSHNQIAQQLSHGYQQMRVVQEARLVAQEQQLRQACGQMLVDLESEICDRERDLALARKNAQDLESMRRLESVEQRRCAFMQRALDEQNNVWPWLRQKQEELDEYRQVASIYQDELSTANELADVLRAENHAWEGRLTSETAAATGIKLSAQLPSPTAGFVKEGAVWRRLPIEAALPSPPLPSPMLWPVSQQAYSLRAPSLRSVARES